MHTAEPSYFEVEIIIIKKLKLINQQQWKESYYCTHS